MSVWKALWIRFNEDPWFNSIHGTFGLSGDPIYVSLEQAEEEISILQRLEHENIIQYVDSFAERSAVIIVTEYLSGGELFVKIADEDYSLTEADCTHFVRQICLGVQYLHSENIVHLDLKVCIYCI